MIFHRQWSRSALQFFLLAALAIGTGSGQSADTGDSNRDPDRNPNGAVVQSTDGGALSRATSPTVASPLDSLSGIVLEVSRVSIRLAEFEVTMDSIFGGLGYSAFGIARSRGSETSQAADLGLDPPQSMFSFGLPAGTNPSAGVLSWSGTVIGADVSESESRGHTILGDVDLSIADILNPRVEIAFTNLFDFDANAPRSSMTWSDVEVNDGAFVVDDEESRLEGTFFGDAHQEVGGVFERDGIRGAYGAQRRDAGALSAKGFSLPNVDEPIDFVGFLTSLLLNGDLSFGTSAVATSTAWNATVGLAPEQSSMLGSDGADSKISQMTIGLQGAFHAGGFATGYFDLVDTVFAGEGDFEIAVDVELTGFLGWLKNGGHNGGQTRIGFGGELGDFELGDFPLPDVMSRFQRAVGAGVVRTPTRGSAQWDGVMVGEDFSDRKTRGNAIRGNARLTINDFERSEVNIEFSDVFDIDARKSRADLIWTDVAMSKGVFRAERDGDLIEGFFIGPNSEEVVGIFERADIFGTFGAVRANPSDNDSVLEPSGPDTDLTPSFQVLAVLEYPGSDATSDSNETLAVAPDWIARAFEDAVGTEHSFNGIVVEEFSNLSIPVEDGTVEFDAWGGWLKHGFLAVSAFGRKSLDEVRSLSGFFAVTLGESPATNPPPGGARWTGAMLGIDVSGTSTRGNRVRGKASIAVDDLYYLNVDILFTEIVDLVTNSGRGDMQWWGIPLFEGSFEASTDNDRISGQFYGPEHEEVGGTFQWREILGAFGAKRAIP